jgi:hypothetical protein
MFNDSKIRMVHDGVLQLTEEVERQERIRSISAQYNACPADSKQFYGKALLEECKCFMAAPGQIQ